MVHNSTASLEEALKELTKERERFKKMQTAHQQMLIDISHGLQTPLTILKNELHRLKKTIDDPARLAVCEKSLEETSLFIYDLLRLARLDGDEHELTLSTISFSTLVKEIVEYFSVLAEDAGISLVSNIEKDIWIAGKKEKLEEVIVNLMSNSVKYRDPQKKSYIHLTVVKENDNAILSITDNGYGISKEDQKHIFTRFYRGQATKEKGIKGSGLGLAIADKIVKKHSGTLSVHSIAGKETTFILRLPLSKKDV